MIKETSIKGNWHASYTHNGLLFLCEMDKECNLFLSTYPWSGDAQHLDEQWLAANLISKKTICAQVGDMCAIDNQLFVSSSDEGVLSISFDSLGNLGDVTSIYKGFEGTTFTIRPVKNEVVFAAGYDGIVFYSLADGTIRHIVTGQDVRFLLTDGINIEVVDPHDNNIRTDFASFESSYDCTVDKHKLFVDHGVTTTVIENVERWDIRPESKQLHVFDFEDNLLRIFQF
jgi:hypothetical protein